MSSKAGEGAEKAAARVVATDPDWRGAHGAAVVWTRPIRLGSGPKDDAVSRVFGQAKQAHRICSETTCRATEVNEGGTRRACVHTGEDSSIAVLFAFGPQSAAQQCSQLSRRNLANEPGAIDADPGEEVSRVALGDLDEHRSWRERAPVLVNGPLGSENIELNGHGCFRVSGRDCPSRSGATPQLGRPEHRRSRRLERLFESGRAGTAWQTDSDGQAARAVIEGRKNGRGPEGPPPVARAGQSSEPADR